MPWPLWSFDGYEFPAADSPVRGSSGEWDAEEKLVEHDPLNADLTVLTSWGFRSGRRTISGVCQQATRDAMRTRWENGTVATLRDGENRSVTARIVSAKFNTIIPSTLYEYTLEFMRR